MDEAPPLAHHCINKYKQAPVKEETKPEIIDLECNETLEPVDFSIKPDKNSDDIKTVVPQAGSSDGPLCLVTHRRKETVVAPSSPRKPASSFQPWHGPQTSAMGSLAPSPHGVRPASGINHIAKHEHHSHSTSPGTQKTHRTVPHSPSPLGQSRPPSGAGNLYGSPAQSISAGLPAHFGISASPNSTRSTPTSTLSAHRQPPTQQHHHHSVGRSISSGTSAKPELKVNFLVLDPILL